MISHVRGILEKKALNQIVVDVNGLGYEVSVPNSTMEKLPGAGHHVKLFTVESVSMYAGGTTLYGFLSEEEKDTFLLLKDNIPGAGAKKALDYLEKVNKSLPDFRKAVLQRNISMLTGVFGFTKKTAEKVASALKDKVGEIQVTGKEKWAAPFASTASAEAVAGLVALGYKESFARDAVDKVSGQDEKEIPVEEIIRKALGHL